MELPCGLTIKGSLRETEGKFKIHQRRCDKCRELVGELAEFNCQIAVSNGWDGLKNGGKKLVTKITSVVETDDGDKIYEVETNSIHDATKKLRKTLLVEKHKVEEQIAETEKKLKQNSTEKPRASLEQQPQQATNKMDSLPVIDGHFWVERDGRIFDAPCEKEYGDICRLHGCDSTDKKYLPAPELTQKLVINIFTKAYGKIALKNEKTSLESLCSWFLKSVEEVYGKGHKRPTDGFGSCLQYAFCELAENGGKLVFGSLGFKRRNRAGHHYEYGGEGEDWKVVADFVVPSGRGEMYSASIVELGKALRA